MLTLDETDSERNFRHEIRSWISVNVPIEHRFPTDLEGRLALDRLLAKAGYLGFTWPVRYGGREGSPLLASILYDELAEIGFVSPASPSHQGVNNIGPTIVVHGSEGQKSLYLPGIMGVKDIWCQGFSEPDAGSDLAGVKTVAIRDGSEGWVINGQKIWTSLAHVANHIYVLARTGPEGDRHRNLTMFLVPMSTPGITTRPIRQSTGDSEFDEVFFDDVWAPEASVLGPINGGWGVAMTTLQSERLSGRHRYHRFHSDLRRLAAEIKARPDAPQRVAWLIELGQVIADVEAMRPLTLRAESLAERGLDVASLPSVAKLWWPPAWQALCELAQKVVESGSYSPEAGRWYYEWLESRPASIYGGSAQIQRNVIAERFLGLPRDPGGR